MLRIRTRHIEELGVAPLVREESVRSRASTIAQDAHDRELACQASLLNLEFVSDGS